MSLTRSLGLPLLAAALATALAACNVDVHSDRGNVKDARFVARDSTRPLGPGDIRVASQDSSVELALIGDALVAGLGPHVRNEIKEKTDTSHVDGDGIGANIEKFVKGTVASALNHEMQFPLSEVSDVRYEDGLLRFYDNDGRPMHVFERGKHDSDRNAMAFSPDDARAFIAAFKARKQGT